MCQQKIVNKVSGHPVYLVPRESFLQTISKNGKINTWRRRRYPQPSLPNGNVYGGGNFIPRSEMDSRNSSRRIELRCRWRGQYRGRGIYIANGSMPVLFWNLHSRGERGRKKFKTKHTEHHKYLEPCNHVYSQHETVEEQCPLEPLEDFLQPQSALPISFSLAVLIPQEKPNFPSLWQQISLPPVRLLIEWHIAKRHLWCCCPCC